MLERVGLFFYHFSSNRLCHSHNPLNQRGQIPLILIKPLPPAVEEYPDSSPFHLILSSIVPSKKQTATKIKLQ
jgi:hypothetical protein